MIPMNLKISLICGLVIYFVLILILLKNKALSLKYTLLWLLAGVVMLIVVIWPGILFTVTRFVGIDSTMNGLYIVCLAFILIILMAITSIVSKQKQQIKTLTQELAILEKRVRETEAEKETMQKTIIETAKDRK